MATGGNRLLPIFGIVMGVLAVVVLLRACGSSEQQGGSRVEKPPKVRQPDADSPAETVKTLTAEVGAMSERFKKLSETNEKLRKELRNQEREVQREVDRRVKKALEERGNDKGSSGGLGSVMDRVDRLSSQVSEMSRKGSNNDSRGEKEWDVPVGLGLNGKGKVVDERGSAETGDQVRMFDRSQMNWVNPVGWNPEKEDQGLGFGSGGGILEDSSEGESSGVGKPVREDADEEGGSERTPAFTVPRNATMMNSTAMTGLIGRIPKDGTVQDPMQFKVIQGRDNLAANGFELPGVAGMVWTGTATGDWNLSCVRGQLDSVTFIFNDGTIRTLPDHRPAVGPGESSDGTGDDEPLGFISDEYGYPCVPGERITNAPSFLLQRAGLAGLQSAANALSSGETKTTLNKEGTRISTITGDEGRFIAGHAVSSGARETVKWLKERQEQSFDAVVTDPGETISLHINRELRIDHVSGPKGRKISYEKKDGGSNRSVRLD